MALKVARRSEVPPFIVMDVMAAAARREAERGDVLHMEVGQPNTPAPALVRAAAERAVRSELLGYTLALGEPALRARIAGHYRLRHGVEVPPERIAVTVGSLGAFQLAFLAAFDAGDRVALASPATPRTATLSRPSG
jgi:aspartate/methionine/tyrosine aminotransferase